MEVNIEIANTLDQLGPLVQKQVVTEEAINNLSNQLVGAHNHENEDAFYASLKEQREHLANIKQQLVMLRMSLRDQYSYKVKLLNMEIQVSDNAFDIEEMKGLVREIENKIEQLTNQIQS